jgi:uncharacterized membrane protein YhaH (DUF805 family)
MAVPIRHVRRFHLARVLGWLAFGAVIYALGQTGSVPILFWISIAALVESSGTDYVQARAAERQDPTAEI